jgi:hypothetical protein
MRNFYEMFLRARSGFEFSHGLLSAASPKYDQKVF